MKKGFTLIELLAVILILGIIALIAIPTVNHILKEARMGAFKSGCDNIMKTMEEACQTSLIKNQNPALSYIFTDGKSSNSIEVKGTLPDDGYVFLDNNCAVTDFYLSDKNNTYSNAEDARKDYMLKAPISSATSIFKSLYPTYYDNIKTVNFLNHLNISNNAIEIKDVSVSENGKVKAWLIQDGELYDLYVGSEGKIYANYDSGYLFSSLEKVTSYDFSNFYTSFANTFVDMFNNNTIVTSLNLSNFDTNNVTSMERLFYKCLSVTSIEVSNWNTSKVTNMRDLFDNCISLKNLNVSNWNTSNVINMQGMFSDLSSLTSLDISKWDTSKVNNMSYMFDGYEYSSGLKTLNLGNFNTSKVNNISFIFSGNSSLTTLDISNWDLSNVTSYNQAFTNTTGLTNVKMNHNDTYNLITSLLLNRTGNTPGTITTTIDKSTLDLISLGNKNWNVI